MTFICAAPLLHDVGEERQEAGPLDRLGELTLLLGRHRGDARRHDLAALGDVALQELDVLVVDLRRAGARERADLAAAEEGTAGAAGAASGGGVVDCGFVGHQKVPSLAGKSSRRSRSRSRRARIGESSSSSSSTRTVRYRRTSSLMLSWRSISFTASAGLSMAKRE